MLITFLRWNRKEFIINFPLILNVSRCSGVYAQQYRGSCSHHRSDALKVYDRRITYFPRYEYQTHTQIPGLSFLLNHPYQEDHSNFFLTQFATIALPSPSLPSARPNQMLLPQALLRPSSIVGVSNSPHLNQFHMAVIPGFLNTLVKYRPSS